MARSCVNVPRRATLGIQTKEAERVCGAAEPDIDAADEQPLLQRVLGRDPLIRGRVGPNEGGGPPVVRRNIHQGEWLFNGAVLTEHCPQRLVGAKGNGHKQYGNRQN